MENCPTIARDGVTPGEYIAVKAAAHKVALNKRLRPNPLGSLDLKFLSETNAQAGLERLKDPSRYEVPSVKSFKSKMELDDMDIEMAMTEEEKNAAMESKASKSWRALRIASTTNILAFDKIERADKIDEVFLDPVKVEEAVSSSQEGNNDDEVGQLKDRRTIIIAGPSGVGKSTLIKMLLTKHPKLLERKVSHTTRAPREGEVDGQHYNFITKEKHSMMRDADEFLEYNNYNGNDYGTSRKLVEGIIARGKIPVMEMEHHQRNIQRKIRMARRKMSKWPRASVQKPIVHPRVINHNQVF
ncbi:putative Guanylate kinase [Glarea lozoyensis 74030]|uniref:Putative Guanylate kinase n=1 Tax=Glarea lozoyensis (strain ATCC 74030 / MF5533) TaxID=1104152 RepID=H0ECP6_GLAL7|nr:putative Guanylate kinase [Glarea lozoyensis 74030]